MAQGIVYTDGTFDVEVRYSDELASAALFSAATFTNDIPELKGVTQNAGTSAQIDLTHFKSTTRERRAGLGDPGSFQFTCNVIFTETNSNADEAQAAVYGMWSSGAVHWWKISLPKAYATSTTPANGESNSGAYIGFSGSVDSANFSISGTDEPAEFTFSVLVDTFSPGVVPETRAA